MTRAPRTTLTFAVVDEQGLRRSLVWRFVIGGSDVYFAPGLHFGAPAPNRYHISLHADGRCHQTFDSQFFSNGGAKRLGRATPHAKEWRRPATPSKGPGVVVYSVGVLPDDPAATPPTRQGETFDMVMPPPAPGFITELQIFYSYVPPARFTVTGGTVLAHHTLANGEIVYFIGFVAPFHTQSLRPLAPPAGRGNAVWLGSEIEPQLPSDFRGVLFCNPDPGAHHHTAIDVSIKVDPANPHHLMYVLATPPDIDSAQCTP